MLLFIYQFFHRLLPFLHAHCSEVCRRQQKSILSNTHETHREPDDATEVVVQADVRTVEEHADRAAAKDVRGRPVAAVAAHKVDRSPVAVARSRQEDRTSLLQSAPLRS